MVFLSKTKLSSVVMKVLTERVLAGRGRKFYRLLVVARGRSGGVALLWLKEIQVSLLSQSSNHIDVEVVGVDSENGFTGVYGWLETQNKLKTCELLHDLKPRSMLLWLIGGDLNEILYHHEKFGGSPKFD